MATTSNPSFRLARLEDYEGVCNIDKDRLDGKDYMPAKFHQYLADPLRLMHVLEINGRIVGLHMFYVVDDGDTVLGQGLRIAPDLRDKGIWRKSRYTLPDPAMVSPEMKYIVASSSHFGVHRQRIRQNKEDFRIIMKRHVISVDFAIDTNLDCPWIKPVGVLEILSSVETKRALSNMDNQWQLFPNGRLVLGFEPFRLLPSNFELISRECVAVFGSHCMTDGEKEGAYSSLSFGSVFQHRRGLTYIVNYYGRDGSDAVAHFLKHMQVANKHWMKGELFGELRSVANGDLNIVLSKLSTIPNIRFKIQAPQYIYQGIWFPFKSKF